MITGKQMYLMGIDPGFSGAIAVLDKDLKIDFVMDMPIISNIHVV